jgi:hypothetical protein
MGRAARRTAVEQRSWTAVLDRVLAGTAVGRPAGHHVAQPVEQGPAAAEVPA